MGLYQAPFTPITKYSVNALAGALGETGEVALSHFYRDEHAPFDRSPMLFRQLNQALGNSHFEWLEHAAHYLKKATTDYHLMQP